MLRFLHKFRHRLSDIDALPQLTLLGAVIGCVAGLFIVMFRYAIEMPLSYFLPLNNENFEGLTPLWQFGLPVVGALIIGAGFHFLDSKQRHVGIGHVLERLHNYEGRMPAINLVVQFVGGAISLICGHSVGREGPAVHIGASISSLIGQWLKLPNNSLGTLIGCGVAAAIAASFNTPIAGVIFAMEVVLMSYTIVGFIPIMMASVCGALIARAAFGNELFLTIENIELNGLIEMPFMVIAGIIVALFASAYIKLQLSFGRFNHYPIFARIMAAGLMTGCVAVFFPEILGLGYDTINLTIEGKLGLGFLLALVLSKIVVTSFSITMGIPGGIIGPQLFIGACIGGFIGIVGNSLFPDNIHNNGIYVLLGMAAMMGAVLNAPLAALMAVLELTYSPGVIFPSMLIIVVACVLTRYLCKCDGIFVAQLQLKGTQLNISPIKQVLGAIGVRSVMTTAFTECESKISTTAAHHLLTMNSLWIIIKTEDDLLLLRAADLALALEILKEDADVIKYDSVAINNEISIDLLEIPAQRFNILPIPELASLFEAKQILDSHPGYALFVTPQIQVTSVSKRLGIITQDTINHYYI
jgi:CIC family chloride channel protein